MTSLLQHQPEGALTLDVPEAASEAASKCPLAIPQTFAYCLEYQQQLASTSAVHWA